MIKGIALFLFSLMLSSIAFTQETNRALFFNGVSDFVEAPHTISNNISTNWTLEALISPSVNNVGYQAIISKNYNPRPASLWLYNDKIEVWFSSPDVSRIQGTVSIETNKWYHVVATYDMNTLSVYVNGVLDVSVPLTVTPETSTNNYFIGQRGDDSFFFNGYIDEVRIWNKTRTQQQINTTKSDTLTTKYYATADSGLVGYWRFNEGAGVSAKDYSISKSNGTVTGAVYESNPVLLGVSDSKKSDSFILSQNYPNPFNPVTTINFQLLTGSKVTLKVFDLLGREITTLVNQQMIAGPHSVDFDATSLSSGIYLYQLKSGDFSTFKKMTVVK